MDLSESKEKRLAQPFAGFWPRALAFGLDYPLLAAYLIVLTGVGFALQTAFPGAWQGLFSSAAAGEGMGFLLVTLPVTLYFALSESSPRQATLGKRRRGLKVVGPGQARLSFGRALVRSLLKFVPWELAHAMIWQVSFAEDPSAPLYSAGFILVWALVGANIASLLLSRTRQTLYDRLAGTRVVRG